MASRRAFKDDPSVSWTVCSAERSLLVPWTSEGVAAEKCVLVRADQRRLFVRLAFGSTWISEGVASEKGLLVRADQEAYFWKSASRNLPSGVPCGEGRIEDEAPGRIEGRAALVTPRNSCPGPATLHVACTPTNRVPSARPLSPNHWGEGSGSCHPRRFNKGGWRGRGGGGCSQEFANSLVQGQVGLRVDGVTFLCLLGRVHLGQGRKGARHRRGHGVRRDAGSQVDDERTRDRAAQRKLAVPMSGTSKVAGFGSERYLRTRRSTTRGYARSLPHMDARSVSRRATRRPSRGESRPWEEPSMFPSGTGFGERQPLVQDRGRGSPVDQVQSAAPHRLRRSC